MMKAPPPEPWSVPLPLSLMRRPNSVKTSIVTLSEALCSRRSAMNALIAAGQLASSRVWVGTSWAW